MESPEDNKFRRLAPAYARVQQGLLIALTLLGVAWSVEIHHYTTLAIFKEQFLALFFSFGMAPVFLGVKAHAGERASVPPWFDRAAIAAAFATGGYVAIFYHELVYDLGTVTVERVVLGLLAIALVLEATRRVLGWALVIVAGVFIFYALFSGYFPGFLNVPGTRWERLVTYLYLDNNALFGLPMFVTSSVIVGFILFGRCLYAVRGDTFLTDFAMSIMGRYRGGPAKVAIVASSLFGTTSGSAVSNVVMDGPITIPMMKNAGYPAPTAAAIEAVASTGGQIMPPVMGITAFLIAEYLGVPYGEIVLAALVPALLYYVALFAQVDLEAGKRGLVGLPREQLPQLFKIMNRGWVFVAPIAVLMWALLWQGWEPGKAAVLASVVTVLIGYFNPATRPTLARLHDAIVETGRTLIDLVVITAIAGLVIGVLQVSGLGSNFSLLLVGLSGDSLFALLVLTALVCIVLGMGLPTAIIYMMLAVLVAPALIEYGVKPIAAHLFLFYFGALSMITPPVCLATFAAAAIAKSDFWETGWAGMRLGIVAYVVPFVMIYQPALIMSGGWLDIALGVSTAVAGVIVLSFGVVGYAARALNPLERIGFFIAGFLWLVTPASGVLGLLLHALGAALTVALLWWARRTVPAAPVARAQQPAA